MHQDLRDWIASAENTGKLLRISGAHWEKEMAALAELFCYKKKLDTPALLFDDIPGHKKGNRVLFHELITPWAVAITLDFPLEYDSLMDLVRAVHQKFEDLAPLPPIQVTTGPVMENVQQGSEVNLLNFPVPLFSEFDGGRYIGTSDCVVMKDPDTGWVNLGSYRMQLHDECSSGLYISPGKHGYLIRQKYFERGLPCPVAVCLGQDPLLSLFSGNEAPHG
ncbi:MAG TPA: UbiD family decarboxylase, partial [Terriglobales bacterium]|nr:UbiD family decarboxylase [Terriglobales bacterium]